MQHHRDPAQHHDPAEYEGCTTHLPATSRAFPEDDQVRGVYQFIYRHVGNREEAEELTERACALGARTASQNAPGVSNRQRMASALREAARSVVADHLAWFYPTASESLTGGESGNQSAGPDVRPGAGGGTPELLHAVLAQLSAYERDFLTYRFLRNSSLAETACMMHLSLDDALALQWCAVTHAARLMARERMKWTASDARPREGVSRTYPSAGGATACRRSAACPRRAARTE